MFPSRFPGLFLLGVGGGIPDAAKAQLLPLAPRFIAGPVAP